MSFGTFCSWGPAASDDLVMLFIQEAGPETFLIGAILGAIAITIHTLRRDPELRLALA